MIINFLKFKTYSAWHQVVFTLISGDSVTNYLMTSEFGSQIKMWTKNYWSFTGIIKTDTTDIDSFGCGTYTLNGNEYEEKIIYHNDKTIINSVLKATLEIKNDTLYQTYHPTDTAGIELVNYTAIEKYIRAK
jgi:hypothetical protein